MTSPLESLGAAQYVLVTTYRKDGTAVPTPVWVVRDGDALAVWTPTQAGKVKRIRRSGEVLVGPCTATGKLTGEETRGQASIMDSAGTARVRTLLAAKYGIMARITLWGSRIRRGLDGTVGIRIALS